MILQVAKVHGCADELEDLLEARSPSLGFGVPYSNTFCGTWNHYGIKVYTIFSLVTSKPSSLGFRGFRV